MDSGNFKKYNRQAKIYFIIAIIYPIIITIFAMSNTYLSGNSACVDSEFYSCTGYFDNIIATTYNVLGDALSFINNFLIIVTVLSIIIALIFSGLSIYDKPDIRENPEPYFIAIILIILIISTYIVFAK